MFAVVADLDESGLCSVDLTHDSRADLVGEFKQHVEYYGHLARGTVAAGAAPRGRPDERFVGCVLRCMGGAWSTRPRAPSPPGGVFPPDWLSEHINHMEKYGLYHLLRPFCTRHPDVLRRAQVT